jgi:hypothetical protein
MAVGPNNPAEGDKRVNQGNDQKDNKRAHGGGESDADKIGKGIDAVDKINKGK